MELRGLPANGRNADRVREQAACVDVMGFGCREPTECPAQRVVSEDAADYGCEPGVCDLGREEVEEAVELVRVSSERGRELGRVGVGRGLECPDVDLEATPELLDTPEHADRVAFGKAGVEQLDVVPDTRVDAPARIDELECEVRRAASCLQPLLPRNRVDPFDDALLCEVCDRAHERSLGPEADARVGAMADVKPFRAERYDEERAGPLEQLVAPPYDVISPEERAEYRARSPYNVVHLTLPDDEEQAARDLSDWRSEGVLE